MERSRKLERIEAGRLLERWRLAITYVFVGTLLVAFLLAWRNAHR